MNLLLDTHVLIWALNDDPRLSEAAKDFILNENNTIYYSVVSIWEIAIKHANHPDNVEFTGKELSEYCKTAGFFCLDVKEKHVHSLETITKKSGAPEHHDPFDRLLLAQAKSEKMSFVTHDSLIAYYEESNVLSV